MTIELTKSPETKAAWVIVSGNRPADKRHPFFRLLDTTDQKYLALARTGFDNEFGSAKAIVLPSGRFLLLLGKGEDKRCTLRKARLLARRLIAAAKAERYSDIALRPEDFMPTPRLALEELVELIAAQAELANFDFNRYKETPKNGWRFVGRLSLAPDRPTPTLLKALERGVIIGEETNKARSLANTPGGDMTPQKLAEAALEAGNEAKLSVRVLDEREMQELGMGGVLGVARGSSERPYFIVMEYRGGRKAEAPTVLIGKGVTFDTGGLNLKPEDGQNDMHMDMSGGAAVIHALTALARLKVKKNVIGLVPAVENMPSGSSYHPGDMLKTMSGKTIEVLNTDAEGRIILADALTYAKKFYNPKSIIDVATLTGAAMRALGQRASALFANDERLGQALQKAGERTGDFVWPLPLWEEFEEEVRGTFGDWANTGKTGYGGAITAAVFLWQFIKYTSTNPGQTIPWAHVDIAPRMTTIDGEYLSKGAAGAGVYLLVDYLRRIR
ncbi:MAG TPA: leucyl aminopeptidase [Candidatus Paceibacterota bacterium]|nr:leucyl aminopeptidase [Candidatus Paceibacterota bacterium]